MSFSSDIKRELCRLISSRECCLVAELAALVRSCGLIVVEGGRDRCLRLTTTRSAIAGKAFKMVRQLSNVTGMITMRKTRKPGPRTDYLVEWSLRGGNLIAILGPLGYLAEEHINIGPIPKTMLSSRCCRYAAYRGFFLGGGYVEDPHQTYHLGLCFSYRSEAAMVLRLLKGDNFPAQLRERDRDYEIYIKSGDAIGTFLAMIQAVRSLLLFEEIRVEKSLRNRVNRLVNCETANLDRTVKSSIKQLRDINYIDRVYGLDTLPEGLQEVARLRRNYPLASLKQLTELMEEPVSRSCVNHRLRKLHSLASNGLDVRSNT